MVAFAAIVQADLSGTAFGGAPTWTDITRFVRLGANPISITKWRQDQLSDVAPSTMQLVLDNMDVPGDATAPNAGRFTPFLTTSPWSPHILPGVRMRSGVTLTLVPTTNLITNPSLEVDASGWGTGFTIARSTAQAYTGSASLLCTTGAATAAAAFWTVNLTIGVTYTWSIWIYLTSVGAGDIIYIDATGPGALDSANINADLTKLNQWQRVTATFTSLGTGAHNLRVIQQGATASTFYLDAAQVEVGAAATDYCDGAQPACAWTGTPNASTSTRPSTFTFWRFDGYVDTWDASYDNGEFGICTVSASDILARLGAVDALRSMYVEECLTDAPFVLYPLTEPAGATSAGDIAGSATGPLANAKTIGHGDLAWATATGIPTDGSSTLTMNGTLTAAAGDDLDGMYLQTDGSVSPIFTGTTLEAWVTLGSTLASTMSRLSAPVVLISTIGNNGLLGTLRLALVYNAGSIQLQDWTGAAVGPNLNDGHLHHIAVTASTATATNNYYVDGALVSSSGASQQLGGGYLQLGGVSQASQGGTGTVFPPFRGGLGYAAIYPSQLSAARVAAHYNAGKTAFAGEGTATHISRLLTYRKNLGATLDSGQGTVSAQAIAGSSEQQGLLDTAKAEGGLVYADPATGKIVFLDRTHLRNPTPVLTLDVTAQQTDADLNVRADRDLLLNDVTISRPSGAGQRKTDQTSKDTHGTKGLSETRIIGSDQDVTNTAGWLVANGKDVRARTPALSVDLLTEPSATIGAGVLALTPLQRVKLTNPPSSMAASDVIVQGCTDTIGVDVFTCAFNVSPLPRPTLRFDAAADSFTKLDSGLVFAW